MAEFYNDWTTAPEPGAQQKPGDRLHSTISGIDAQVAHLTNQINVVNAKVAAAGGVTGSIWVLLKHHQLFLAGT